jgi:hypothetical protein
LNSTPDSPRSLVAWILMQLNRISSVLIPLTPWQKFKIQWPGAPRYLRGPVHKYLGSLVTYLTTFTEVTAVKISLLKWVEVEFRTTGESG